MLRPGADCGPEEYSFPWDLCHVCTSSVGEKGRGRRVTSQCGVAALQLAQRVFNNLGAYL